jgi:hypothetical protein
MTGAWPAVIAAAFAHSRNGGLIVTGSPLAALHRDLIIALAARYKLPAVYVERFFVAAGGLMSYGPNFVDQYRQRGWLLLTASSKARSRPTFQSSSPRNSSW